MEDWAQFVLVAVVVFAVIAVTGSLLLPPDPYSMAPVTVAALVLSWPVAYWFVYVRAAATTSKSGT
jgi:hypothetical protein